MWSGHSGSDGLNEFASEALKCATTTLRSLMFDVIALYHFGFSFFCDISFRFILARANIIYVVAPHCSIFCLYSN